MNPQHQCREHQRSLVQREIRRYDVVRAKTKGDDRDEWQVKVRCCVAVNALCARFSVWLCGHVSHNSEHQSGLLEPQQEHKHTPVTHPDRCLSPGARIHHGEHGVEEWQHGGTGQNNFVREGAQWDHIQDPCSHLSEAQSHLPRLCREEILPLWPGCQNPSDEKRDAERWRDCSGWCLHLSLTPLLSDWNPPQQDLSPPCLILVLFVCLPPVVPQSGAVHSASNELPHHEPLPGVREKQQDVVFILHLRVGQHHREEADPHR